MVGVAAKEVPHVLGNAGVWWLSCERGAALPAGCDCVSQGIVVFSKSRSNKAMLATAECEGIVHRHAAKAGPVKEGKERDRGLGVIA